MCCKCTGACINGNSVLECESEGGYLVVENKLYVFLLNSLLWKDFLCKR
jgi:hypothetical protein